VRLRAEVKGLSIEEAAADLVGEKMPTRRFAMPSDVGATCVFLCQHSAAQITGTALPLDGGWSAL
jgi:3-hydroxybutyrate dehydrogenase